MIHDIHACRTTKKYAIIIVSKTKSFLMATTKCVYGVPICNVSDVEKLVETVIITPL